MYNVHLYFSFEILNKLKHQRRTKHSIRTFPLRFVLYFVLWIHGSTIYMYTCICIYRIKYIIIVVVAVAVVIIISSSLIFPLLGDLVPLLLFLLLICSLLLCFIINLLGLQEVGASVCVCAWHCQCFILYSLFTYRIASDRRRKTSYSMLFDVWSLHCNDFTSLFAFLLVPLCAPYFYFQIRIIIKFHSNDYYYWSLNEPNHDNFIVSFFYRFQHLNIDSNNERKSINRIGLPNLIIIIMVACCLLSQTRAQFNSILISSALSSPIKR